MADEDDDHSDEGDETEDIGGRLEVFATKANGFSLPPEVTETTMSKAMMTPMRLSPTMSRKQRGRRRWLPGFGHLLLHGPAAGERHELSGND